MIYDCFTFFNELDLLEIRLHELNAVVDKFVLVEATLTHQGKPKALHYDLNKARYSAFHHKIIHVIVDQYPENTNGDSWIFEKHQRNSIMMGLKDAKNGDQIIISDIDEIPRPEKISEAAAMKGVRIFRQRMYYYYLNCINATEFGAQKYFWSGSIMVAFEDIKGPVQEYRETGMLMTNKFNPDWKRRWYWSLKLFFIIRKKGWKISFINDSGWHFSYLGGVDKIIQKLEAFAHSEYNKEQYKDPEKIRTAIANGEDIFGRGFQYRFVEMNSEWPDYIMKNKEKFASLYHQA